MRGCKGCESHGGIRALAKRGEFQPSGRTALFKAERAAAAVEGRTPAAPFELMRLEIYQAGQPVDEDATGTGVGDGGVVAVGAAN